jgi:hypothetical protein
VQRSNVTNIQRSEETSSPSEAQAKWGDAIRAGFQVLPDALIRGQHLLKLSAMDVVVIANLNQAWWFEDSLPYLQPYIDSEANGGVGTLGSAKSQPATQEGLSSAGARTAG